MSLTYKFKMCHFPENKKKKSKKCLPLDLGLFWKYFLPCQNNVHSLFMSFSHDKGGNK